MVATVDRLDHLVRLFEHIRFQRVDGLLAIPWAALGGPQRGDDIDEARELSHLLKLARRVNYQMSELSFTAFVLSIASTAAIHFGDLPDPATGQASETNLEGASQMIEILALLEQK